MSSLEGRKWLAKWGSGISRCLPWVFEPNLEECGDGLLEHMILLAR